MIATPESVLFERLSCPLCRRGQTCPDHFSGTILGGVGLMSSPSVPDGMAFLYDGDRLVGIIKGIGSGDGRA